jgi:hypothetical protein
VFYPNGSQQPPIASTARSKISASGDVESFDDILDHSSEELWKYFLTHLNPPRMNVQISGFHMVTYQKTQTVNGRDETRTCHERVTDFDFTIPVNVSPQWTRIVCVPAKTGDPFMPFKETLEAYVQSSSLMKEIQMNKQILWNYAELVRSLEYCIRCTGFPHQIEIKFPSKGDKVIAYSSGALSRLSHNCMVRTLCVLSCLWIIFLPIFCMLSKI